MDEIWGQRAVFDSRLAQGIRVKTATLHCVLEPKKKNPRSVCGMASVAPWQFEGARGAKCPKCIRGLTRAQEAGHTPSAVKQKKKG